jgi:hypothetical protein
MYTFQDHAKRCYEAAKAGETLVQWVQVKQAGITACAVIDDAWTSPAGVDLWRVRLERPHFGLFYVPPSKVRQCSGVDGHCGCAGEPCGAHADEEVTC